MKNELNQRKNNHGLQTQKEKTDAKENRSVIDETCRLIELPKIVDPRGNLTVVEQLKEVPFEIRRAYWTYDVPGGESRGGHAHKHLFQLLIAVSGSFTVTLDDGLQRKTYLLNHPWQGLLIGPGVWRTLDDFSSGAVCLVLASELFEEEDYLYDYQEFLNYKQATCSR